jgi:4-coumarate--CoA ligase
MKRFDLQLYLILIERHSATFLGCPPPVILLLAKSPACAGFKFSHMRQAICGAAPSEPRLTRFSSNARACYSDKHGA